MAWQNYVTAATELGFAKVVIINRKNFRTLATTNELTDIALVCDIGDDEMNENKELSHDWKDKKKVTFAFFGETFNIILRDDDDGEFLVCLNGKKVLCARQFKTIWFVVFATIKPIHAPKTHPGFKGAPDAFAQISNNIWDALAEAGV